MPGMSLAPHSPAILDIHQLHFAPDGRVADHRDYWDPAEELWQKLPLLGPPVRWLRRRFTVPMR